MGISGQAGSGNQLTLVSPPGNPLVADVDDRGKVRPFDASGYADYRSATAEKLRQMFVNGIARTTWFAEALLRKRWSVIFATEPAFITADPPVSIANRTHDRFGIKTPGTILSFPLCPSRVLFMDDRLDQPKGHYYPLGSDGPGPFNLGAWQCCERFMISPRSTDEVCAEILAWADASQEQQGAV